MKAHFYSYYSNTIIYSQMTMRSEMCSLTTKCVHSLLGKQEALAIMGQSLEKGFIKCFSYIGS